MKLAVPAAFRPLIEAALPDDFECAYFNDGEDAWQVVPGAEIVAIPFFNKAQVAQTIEAGDALAWVAYMPSGMDGINLEQTGARGIAVTNGAGIGSIPIAEFALMGMLALAKNLPAHLAGNARHEWLPASPGMDEIHGAKVLIIGYGSIGRTLGRLLGAIGAEVTGVRRTADGEPGVIGADDWRPRLAEFDWVVLSATPNAQTRGMIGAAELSAMKPTARLVNVARGVLVDQAALIGALETRQIAGAFLDVVESEPLPAEDPLWEAPNLVITSHKSALSARMNERRAALFLDNLRRYRAGEPLLNRVS
jgi:phosphoglycerate dehydrogenase-like enzyme